MRAERTVEWLGVGCPEDPHPNPLPAGEEGRGGAACGGLLTAWRGCWGWQAPSSQHSPSRAKEEERHPPVGVPGHGGGFGAMRPRGPRQSIPFRIARLQGNGGVGYRGRGGLPVGGGVNGRPLLAHFSPCIPSTGRSHAMPSLPAVSGLPAEPATLSPRVPGVLLAAPSVVTSSACPKTTVVV